MCSQLIQNYNFNTINHPKVKIYSSCSAENLHVACDMFQQPPQQLNMYSYCTCDCEGQLLLLGS